MTENITFLQTTYVGTTRINGHPVKGGTCRCLTMLYLHCSLIFKSNSVFPVVILSSVENFIQNDIRVNTSAYFICNRPSAPHTRNDLVLTRFLQSHNYKMLDMRNQFIYNQSPYHIGILQVKNANTLLDQSQQPYHYLVESIRTRDRQISEQKKHIVELEEDLRYGSICL